MRLLTRIQLEALLAEAEATGIRDPAHDPQKRFVPAPAKFQQLAHRANEVAPQVAKVEQTTRKHRAALRRLSFTARECNRPTKLRIARWPGQPGGANGVRPATLDLAVPAARRRAGLEALAATTPAANLQNLTHRQ